MIGIEPVKEVTPKAPLSYLLIDIPVGCCNKSYIDISNPSAPETVEFLFLDDT